MEAKNTKKKQNFAGTQHTLADFHQLMERLVKMEDSQYSYRNVLMAMTTDGVVAGILVAYDGAQLKTLRKRFLDETLATFGIDYSGMDAETQEGEYYLDSLAVSSSYRGKGIAKLLLNAAIQRGKELGIPKVGLLVDKGNPRAESLYTRMGFQFVNYTTWGGHGMKHLQINAE